MKWKLTFKSDKGGVAPEVIGTFDRREDCTHRQHELIRAPGGTFYKNGTWSVREIKRKAA